MNYDDALAYLDAHATYEKTGRITAPTTERIERLVAAMGDPQGAYPVIHITGTNGKGSTSQMITRLLMSQGLTVGTYTSPHLERVNERIARNSEPIADDDFAEQIAAVANLEGLTGTRPGTSRRSRRRRCAGSPTSPSTWRSSRSGCSVVGTRPTWWRRRWLWSPTSGWTTTSSPGRRSPTSPARRQGSSSRAAWR